MKQILLFILACILTSASWSQQSPLSRKVTLNVSRQRLEDVLEILGNSGQFSFSYNSSIINRDSLVSLNVRNKSVRTILAILLSNRYELKETGNYIIIRPAPINIAPIAEENITAERRFSIEGYIYDEQTGAPIADASVYEKRLLAATLSNADGSFRLQLKSSKTDFATLSISKEFYFDTSLRINSSHGQPVTIKMLASGTPAAEDYKRLPDSLAQLHLVDSVPEPVVENTGIGQLLLSASQKMQSVNLGHFFTSRPFQLSLVPGLSTQGKLSGQVVNNFSFNVLGGYTGGTNGIEVAGLFNIDRKNVRYLQIAGLSNLVGGKTQGLQIAGIANTNLDSTEAWQLGGLSNFVKGPFRGIQLSGLYNHVTDTVKGAQFAGVANFSRKNVAGVQLGGVVNVAAQELEGVQAAGLLNYARTLKGVQFGLINIADSSEGYSVGLINIILHGYHQLAIYSNEINQLNLAFKTGNKKLYSILLAGTNTDSSRKSFSFGYGLGLESGLNKNGSLSLNPELSSQYVYLGNFEEFNLVNRLQLLLSWRPVKFLHIFAGPAYSVSISDQKAGNNGYAFPLPAQAYPTQRYSNRVSGWVGWTAGIALF